MLSGENQPERQQHSIKNSLLDVAEKKHVRHLKLQGQILQGNYSKREWKVFYKILKRIGVRTVENGQCDAEGEKHCFQKSRRPSEELDALPEPDYYADHNGKEERFERQPDFGEPAVLVDGDEPQIRHRTEVSVVLVNNRQSDV